MLNIVIPMAGRGTRFSSRGYKEPKPLIPIHNRPMIELVIRNLRPLAAHRFIFICLKEHDAHFNLQENLRRFAPGCEVVFIEAVTEGAACTVLLAKEYINNEESLMIANSDQWVDININEYLASMDKTRADGLIMTMRADDPKWSFIRLDGYNRILEVVEKKVVSNEATVGIYNFRKGRDFVQAAENMIHKNLRVNNEFYVAPVYNELIKEGMNIVYYNIGREGDGMYGLGTPEDLEKFMCLPVSRRASSATA